jgi:hypothetical protein
MVNPNLVSVTKGSWVKVATNVTNLGVWVVNNGANYTWTYRNTGDAAPTLAEERVRMPYPGKHFAANAAFDLYIWCDLEDGRLRLDEDFQAEFLINA